jgi:hypothetical protein
MTAFKKFDPQAFLERERLALDSSETLAALATLAGQPLESEIRTTSSPMPRWDYGGSAAKSSEIQRDDPIVEHGLDHLGKNQNLTPTPAKAAKAAKDKHFSNFGSLPAALDALERKCPDLVPDDRWQQAVEDGRQFLATWAEQAHSLGWKPQDLFGLHPVPAKPHASFHRLSRYDSTGLVWLLRGRVVVKMTADCAVIRTASDGTLIYRKNNKPALGPFGDSLDDMGQL